MTTVTGGLALVAGLLVGAVRGQVTHIGRLGDAAWGIGALIVPGSLFGFALGVLLLSAPLAIAAVLIIELVVDVALIAVPGGIGVYFASSSLPNWLLSGEGPVAALSSCVIWLVLPTGIGLLRFLRREAA
jgi:hypothetical protein